MPITQGRMIAIINAAEEYKSALTEVERSLTALYSRSYALTHTQLMGEIQTILTNVGFMIQERTKHDVAIVSEFNRFRSNYGRNERQKLKMENKRRQAGVPQRAQPRMHYNEKDRLVTRVNTAVAQPQQTMEQRINAEIDKMEEMGMITVPVEDEDDTSLGHDKEGQRVRINLTDTNEENEE